MSEVEQLEVALTKAREAADRATLAEVCQVVGIGVADVLGKSRRANVARARAAVAWSLHRKLKWPQKRVAALLGVSSRMVKKMTVSSPAQGN